MLKHTQSAVTFELEKGMLTNHTLHNAIFNSANFISMATDTQGVIQLFNIGAQQMLGYAADEVINKLTPADIADQPEIVARAKSLSEEFDIIVEPGVETLMFKASSGLEDTNQLTYICKDGSRFSAMVSVTALHDLQENIFGYLLIGTDNSARKAAEEALLKADALLIDTDNSARKAAEEALLKADALQSAIFNSANFSSIATDAKGVIQIFNVGAERMLGYAAIDVINKWTPADISDPQEVIARAKELSEELGTCIQPGFEALVFKASRGIEDIYELTYIRKDGCRFPAIVSVTALRDAQDTIIGYLLIGTDNSARQEADDKLWQASQYARSLIEASLDPLVTINVDGKITDVNEACIEATGVPRDKLIGTDFSNYFTEPQEASKGYREAFSKGSVTDYPLTIRHRNGRIMEVLVNVSVYRDDKGEVLGLFAAARDITMRKRADEALVKAGALQSAIFNSANFSSIATDAKGVIQIFNVGAERMLGYTAVDMVDKLTPADISDPQELVLRAKVLTNELDTPITPGFEALVFKASRGIEDIYELTYIRKDGSRFAAIVSVTALRDDQNNIIGYLLIGTDNTARKQAEEALLKAGALQSAIFNSANFSSIATDAKGVIQIFNVGAERMLGYTAVDMVDKLTPADISDPQELVLRAKVLTKELDTPITPGFEALVFKASRGIEDIYELTYIRKDGSRFPAMVSVTALRDDQNNIIGYLLIGTDNTARKQAEEALLKAGALQSAIFNSANFSSIATDAKGVIQIFNVGAERMLGYTAVDMVDKLTPADISDPQELVIRAKVLTKELDTPITPGFEALVFKASRGIEDIYELTYIRKDGSRFPAVVSVTALRDAQNNIIGYLLIGTDNTARKQAEEALLKAGALQSAIFNSANFSSIATDAKGVIQIFNVGAERMLGYTAAEVMDKITPADISDPQEIIVRAAELSKELETAIAPGFEALVFKASRGIEDIYQLTYIRKDGSRFPALVSVTALRDAKNTIIGYLLIGTDNTVRIQVEEERELLTARLQHKNAELEFSRVIAEKANRAKSEFLSSMSHELRTPLNAILGFAQLLEKGKPAPTEAQSIRLHQIIKAGWYLLELINEVLDLAVIESGRLSLSQESVLLIDVIQESRAMIEPLAFKSGIHLKFLPFDKSWHANADHTRLKQVLINLLTNAIKYNRHDGTIVVQCSEIKGSGSTAERIRINIKDSGNGLSPEKIKQLYQPFNRLGQEEGAEEGTGIGLVVTKQLVELMGGSIGVKSTVGVGSDFWIELNRDAAPIRGESIALPTDSIPQMLGDGICSLLYVEDNLANLMLVQQIIDDQTNVRMLSASDGPQGIALARTQLPDVILMDINLPGISGIEALAILKNDPLTAHIPVLAISANAIPGDIQKGLEAGFLRYLTKPIKISEFIEALDFALENSTLSSSK